MPAGLKQASDVGGHSRWVDACPRYYFPITSATGKTVVDSSGVQLADDETARIYGLQVIAEVKADPRADYDGW